MGFKKSVKTYTLKFKDPEYIGLEVKAKSMPTGIFLKMMRQTELTDDEKIARSDDMIKLFASSIVAWNLEDEQGKPVPKTLKGLEAQDFDFVSLLVSTWIDTVSGVDESLEKKSNSGNQFPAVSIPMETL